MEPCNRRVTRILQTGSSKHTVACTTKTAGDPQSTTHNSWPKGPISRKSPYFQHDSLPIETQV